MASNLMQNTICQSCGMPLTSKEQMGLEKDGSASVDYCKYCYERGEFIHKVSMQECIEMCSLYGAQVSPL
ncbi:zinc ribbon domain-containing protein [Helicobacter ganmani]|uniref:zinc ribbon domain-containing protein n=1 Tax=Helicobacter ganmani TaxID=60246 RepID=UPI003A83964E